MNLVTVGELIAALKGCDRSAKVFISIDEEGNQYKPLDGDMMKGLYSGRASNDDEWEMVGAYLNTRNDKFTVLMPIG